MVFNKSLKLNKTKNLKFYKKNIFKGGLNSIKKKRLELGNDSKHDIDYKNIIKKKIDALEIHIEANLNLSYTIIRNAHRVLNNPDSTYIQIKNANIVTKTILDLRELLINIKNNINIIQDKYKSRTFFIFKKKKEDYEKFIEDLDIIYKEIKEIEIKSHTVIKLMDDYKESKINQRTFIDGFKLVFSPDMLGTLAGTLGLTIASCAAISSLLGISSSPKKKLHSGK
jgi:hypothetical protein